MAWLDLSSSYPVTNLWRHRGLDYSRQASPYDTLSLEQPMTGPQLVLPLVLHLETCLWNYYPCDNNTNQDPVSRGLVDLQNMLTLLPPCQHISICLRVRRQRSPSPSQPGIHLFPGSMEKGSSMNPLFCFIPVTGVYCPCIKALSCRMKGT